eukprot:Clim_evm26s139 gene=Clim_evmTU26s139
MERDEYGRKKWVTVPSSGNIPAQDTSQTHVALSIDGRIIDPDTFTCFVCGYKASDTLNWLEHTSSPAHMAKTGKSHLIERATLADVQSQLQTLRTKYVVRKETQRKEEIKDCIDKDDTGDSPSGPENDLGKTMGFTPFG